MENRPQWKRFFLLKKFTSNSLRNSSLKIKMFLKKSKKIFKLDVGCRLVKIKSGNVTGIVSAFAKYLFLQNI